MRNKIQEQMLLVYPFIDHEHARELRRIGDLLDQLPEAGGLVYEDLVAHEPDTSNGRPGLSGDQVLRLLILKQMNGFSYQELAFHLADSRCFRAFCGFGIDEKSPKKSTLQENIKRVQPDTLELVNRLILATAAEEKVENGHKVRIDCTVVESKTHHPTDSSLLYDTVRVLARLMSWGAVQTSSVFVNHTKRAKRRALEILNARTKEKRKKPYRDLLKVARDTVVMAENMAVAGCQDKIRTGLLHYLPLARRVIKQTERRVFLEEVVPAGEKVVSIFEDHADIIIKDRRETYYGHKICLTSGKSGLFLDCVIENGNPADSVLAIGMVSRQTTLYGQPPRQAAFDGGFAAKANLNSLKAAGVADVMFSKKRGRRLWTWPGAATCTRNCGTGGRVSKA